MDLSEYIISFYSIFVGFAASTYIVGWGNIIKDLGHTRPYWGQLTWSLAFFSLMLNDWWIQYRHVGDLNLHPTNLLSMLYQPTMVYFIGILIFPNEHRPEGRIDHVAHFEQHKRSIMVLTLLIIGKIFWQAAPTLMEFNNTRRDTGIFFLLILAGLFVKKRWYAELLGTFAMAFWVWRFWIMG